VKVDLDGVPETALWTLYHRAREARRSDALLDDPMAIDLVDRIDFPFAERFGAGFPAQTQLLALRVRAFDGAIRSFLRARPQGTVVALGEGLETQFWRVDNRQLTWLTVDLPRSIEIRKRLLPMGPRQVTHAGSAIETSWMDKVGSPEGVLVTAQGLLMYLAETDVRRLLAALAQRFPGGQMVLDTVPAWMAKAVSRASASATGYRPPPMPWTIDSSAWKSLGDIHPNIVDVTEVTSPPGRGIIGWMSPRMNRFPVLRHHRPGVVRLTFGDLSRSQR